MKLKLQCKSERKAVASAISEVTKQAVVYAKTPTYAYDVGAWQIEGTLREFPKFSPMQLWFDYPVHQIDSTGVLKDIVANENLTAKGSPWKKNFSNKKTSEERQQSFETAFSGVAENGKATVKELAEYMGVAEKTIRNRVKDNKDYWCSDGEIGLK